MARAALERFVFALERVAGAPVIEALRRSFVPVHQVELDPTVDSLSRFGSRVRALVWPTRSLVGAQRWFDELYVWTADFEPDRSLRSQIQLAAMEHAFSMLEHERVERIAVTVSFGSIERSLESLANTLEAHRLTAHRLSMLLRGAMERLRPLLAETGVETVGKFLMGTVKGDVHDIGKNLVNIMLEGAGFEVIDLGINNPVEKYLAALEEHQPDILGMSALLTTTMPYMKVVIDTLKEKGLRDDYIVLVGGAPLNEAFAQAVGADAYCRDAAVAVETAKEFVARRHNRLGQRVVA